MSMEAYQDLLQQTSRLRSISIDADGDFYLRAPALEGMSQLEVKVDPKILSPVALSDNFEATTPLIPVPLSMAVVRPLIDPVRWGDFSDIQTSNVAKRQSIASGAWEGTIEEKFRWRFLGITVDFWNVLAIDFTVGPHQVNVNFDLVKILSGDLDFETGYLRLEQTAVPGVTGLTSKKALRYAAESELCFFPGWALAKILLVWLTVTTAQYALRMVQSAGPNLTDAAANLALVQLQAALLEFRTQVHTPAL